MNDFIINLFDSAWRIGGKCFMSGFHTNPEICVTHWTTIYKFVENNYLVYEMFSSQVKGLDMYNFLTDSLAMSNTLNY